MVVFRSKDQFMLTPAIGFLKEYGWIYVNVSWLWYGVNVKLFQINGKDI